MGGMKVVVVKALENGYIDVEDLKAKATEHAANFSRHYDHVSIYLWCL